jgi:hypothetical protein
MLWHLFDRCPVLPVDAAVPLTQYLRTVSETMAGAAELEATNTPEARERAALLHIRVLQLVCKTLPAHPEAALPEGAPLVAALARRADPAFTRLEAYAAQLARATAPPQPPALALRPAPRPRLACRRVLVAEALLEVFERGVEPLAAIAGRPVDGGDADGDIETDVLHVTALVLPAQRAVDAAGGEPELRYPGDVAALLAAKGLLHLGWLRLEDPDRAGTALGPRAHRLQCSCQSALEETVTGVVVRRADRRDLLVVDWFQTGAGADDAGSSSVRLGESDAAEAEDAAAGDVAAGFVRARHVVVEPIPDGPPFKLYDLRPMAAVHEAKAMGKASKVEGAEAE